ncbi:MAG: DUF1501 domain-containing protein [Alphaproteobacteria bacterium]|nr:DUF1501 domain-containing protein [Alphaproteobacteria bacterium]
MPLTRRQLLASSAGLAAGLALPGLARAVSASDRRFLFLYVRGGWDPPLVFAPGFDVEGVYTGEASTPATYGDCQLVAAPQRPAADAFFSQHIDRCCILNGLEVRSVTHATCQRISHTGSSRAQGDDWAAILGAAAPHLVLPTLVVSGVSFTDQYGGVVTRLGRRGQLLGLLDGSALEDRAQGYTPADPAVEALVNQAVRARVEAAEIEAPDAQLSFASAHAQALDRRDRLVELAADPDLQMPDDGSYQPASTRVIPALRCFELGLSRCAVVEHGGYLNHGWDTHSDIEEQTLHYEELFVDLQLIMDELDSRPGPLGGSLADETTVVVFSEMGRAPSLNSAFGKDHWTYTSVMLLGSGVRGNQVIGGFDSGWRGHRVDRFTGEADEGGVAMTAAHLGATLMALGDVDPEEHLPGIEPIEAALD